MTMKNLFRDHDTGGMRMSLKCVLLYCAFIVWGCLIVFKLVHVMFVQRQYWHDVQKSLTMENTEIPPRRGDIFSDDGMLLASSMKQYRIFLDFKSVEKDELRRSKDQYRKDTLFERHLDEFAAVVNGLFPQYTVLQLKQHYRNGFRQKSQSWVLLPGTSRNTYPVPYDKYKILSSTVWLKPRYEYWFFSQDSKISRRKPFGALASRTIGSMYEAKDSARNGLELSFDSLLRGVPGIGHKEKIQNISTVVSDIQQIDGCDVWTTLNVDIQDIAENALRRQVENLGAASGLVAVMDVSTGDIKAMASLNRDDDGDYSEIQNNVVKELYEPGSTFKTVSFMIGLDDDKFSIHDSVFCENGSYRGFGGANMTDGSHKGVVGFGWLDAEHILMNSCNIGTAKLINAAYGENPQEFVDKIKATGIGTHFDMQLIGTNAPVIRRDGYWDKTRLPWMSIGYNTQLPAINTLAFYNAIANDGRMVAPRLVTKVTKEGNVVEKFPVKVVNDKICKESTLRTIRYLLERVVEGGTGAPAGSDRFKSAGKTGTAQISQGAAGYKAGGTTHMVSFCGYFPADRPLYSCIVSIRTSAGSGMAASGGTMAGTVFKEISEKIMFMHSRKDIDVAQDTLHDRMPKILNGNLKSASIVLHGLGMSKSDHIAYVDNPDSIFGKVVQDGARYSSDRYSLKRGYLPDVVGLGAQDALYILEKSGYKVEMTGVGKVVLQEPHGKQNIHTGSTVRIKLDMKQNL